MSITTGALASAANFNAAFASKSSANTLAEVQTNEKQVVIKEIATPATPSSGYGAVYFKTDGELYVKNDAGTESKVSNQASSTGAPTIQKFTSGSGTYTTPANVLYLRVTMVGAGGGGSGSGTGSGGNGGTGGATTFGSSLLTANGGTGGIFNTGALATGGTASLGTGPIGVAITGAPGTPAGYYGPIGGQGASAPYFGGGGSGAQSFAVAAGGAGVTNTGGGGGGGSYTLNNGVGGGGGGSGGFIEAIISSPSSTYTYAVGAAGTAGTAGTSGAAGGAGGSGTIIVKEFY